MSDIIGPYHYNHALHDARAMIEEQTQNMIQTFYKMEKVTEFIK
ncbi:hypothetical protein TSL6_08540 [Sulfurovum sp. TSL6]|nr:DUF2164 family protein [Sulfurovum sp. TSL6]GIU00348.1 hypothetical protein TSL6_08540 [Sulfurovum sp. TSL6]